MEYLNEKTTSFVAIRAMAQAVIDGSPKLRVICLADSEPDDYRKMIIDAMIRNMLHVVGRDREVRILESYYHY